jgi:hypothetical protein
VHSKKPSKPLANSLEMWAMPLARPSKLLARFKEDLENLKTDAKDLKEAWKKFDEATISNNSRLGSAIDSLLGTLESATDLLGNKGGYGGSRGGRGSPLFSFFVGKGLPPAYAGQCVVFGWCIGCLSVVCRFFPQSAAKALRRLLQ